MEANCVKCNRSGNLQLHLAGLVLLILAVVFVRQAVINATTAATAATATAAAAAITTTTLTTNAGDLKWWKGLSSHQVEEVSKLVAQMPADVLQGLQATVAKMSAGELKKTLAAAGAVLLETNPCVQHAQGAVAAAAGCNMAMMSYNLESLRDICPGLACCATELCQFTAMVSRCGLAYCRHLRDDVDFYCQ